MQPPGKRPPPHRTARCSRTVSPRAGKTFYTVFLCHLLFRRSRGEDTPLLSTTDPFVVVIVVHRKEIENQWVETVQQRLKGSASVQVLSRKSRLEPSLMPIRFYIINVCNIEQRWTPEAPMECSVLAMDEAHCYVTEKGIRCMMSIRPRYLLALTATPDRSDGRSAALDMIAAPRVVRHLYRLFHVYSFRTEFKCRVVMQPSTGKLDWNHILEAQALSERRNRLICEFALLYWRAEKTVLVLTKRVEQADRLHKMLEKVRGAFVASEVLVGGKRIATNEVAGQGRPRVLITTYSKVCPTLSTLMPNGAPPRSCAHTLRSQSGTGFSDSRLDTLILAADVDENIMQFAGRVFRRPDACPTIIDLVDEGVPGMRKHFQSRCEAYRRMGGYVMPFTSVHDCSALPLDLDW